jgi:hypothetical protein
MTFRAIVRPMAKKRRQAAALQMDIFLEGVI